MSFWLVWKRLRKTWGRSAGGEVGVKLGADGQNDLLNTGCLKRAKRISSPLISTDSNADSLVSEIC